MILEHLFSDDLDHFAGASMPEKHVSFSSYEKQINSLTPETASPLSPADNTLLTDSFTPNGRALRPPRLLLTLLGDYWWKCQEQLPSAALVALLTDFGISNTAARAALNRLVRHDLLVTSKHGRQTFYGLSERASQVLDDGVRRIFTFGQHSHPWDGHWSVVAFSIPEEKRRLRYVLRDQLRWLGFAPLYDGLWISPRASLHDTSARLAKLSIHTATLFRARVLEGTPEAGLPQQAWDLNSLRTQYQQFIYMVQPLSVRIQSSSLSSDDALQARTRIMDAWRRFPTLDPDLPTQLLPANWPRAQARQLFIETYDALGPLALRRVQQIIARYAPDLAKSVTFHRSDTWLIAESSPTYD
jgi:phenylacetic acid degradation operon negative regulatory protein